MVQPSRNGLASEKIMVAYLLLSLNAEMRLPGVYTFFFLPQDFRQGRRRSHISGRAQKYHEKSGREND